MNPDREGAPAYPETVLGTPGRYRGEHVGNFFLANKLGAEEFNRDDEGPWRGSVCLWGMASSVGEVPMNEANRGELFRR